MTLKAWIEIARWQTATISGRTGRAPLLLATFPLCLLLAWLLGVEPHTAALREQLARLERQLHTPMPLEQQQPDLEARVSVSEYQQVRIVFGQLQKNGLKVEASRYQLDDINGQPSLLLNIPLRGEYLSLMEALETLSRTLPVQIETLTLQRSTPLENQLSIALQLRLLKEAP